MKFTFDQLEAFIAVAEEEHFSRAAERLHISQPPLSRQIQTLERHLDAQLFDRRGRRTRLTPAGAMFLVEARRIVRLAHDAGDLVRRSTEGISGAVHVGYTSVVGNAVLPWLLARASAELPHLRLVLHEVRTPDQQAALRSGRIDVALGRVFDDADDLSSASLPPDDLVLAWSRTRGGSPPRSLADLVGKPFVMYSDDQPRYIHDIVTAVFAVHGVHPNVLQRAMEVYTILSLVDAGVGMAIVPRSTSNWSGANTGFVDLPELQGVATRSTAVWRSVPTNPSVPHLVRLFDDVPHVDEGMNPARIGL